MDGLFIEVFTKAGAWKAAADVGRTFVAALPNDTWTKPRKLIARQVLAAAEFEEALANGGVDRVGQFANEWKAIQEAIEKDRTDNAERRDPLWSVLGKN